MANNIKDVFEIIRAALNTALVPADFPHNLSTTPKHPEHVDEDSEFPYFCMLYAGETPDYEGSDIRWIQPARELAQLQIWLVIAEGAVDCLSVDLMAIVQKVRSAITTITSNTANRFRVGVKEVEATYDSAGRWGMATITVVVGAYGN